jgi:hypothetical protein
MQALNYEEMESSSDIDLRDVSWWKFIKDTCRLEVPVTRLSKEGCISLVGEGKPSCCAHMHDRSKCGLPST